MDSGVCAVAPSTPKPPARLTAATTSRQWLKASRGNSMPSMSQIGDFMALFSPGGSFVLLSCFERRRALMPLAHRTPESQAGFAGPDLRAGAGRSASALTHSVRQNMQIGDGALPLALSFPAENAGGQRQESSREFYMSATPSVPRQSADCYDVVVVGAGFAGMYM